MRKIFVIARREYLATVKTKAFVFTILFVPFMGVLSVFAQKWAMRVAENSERRIAIVDRTPGQAAFKALTTANDLRRANFEEAAAKKGERKGRDRREIDEDETPRPFTLDAVAPAADTEGAKDEQRLALSERVRKGELSGFLEVGAEGMAPIDMASILMSAFRPAAKPAADAGSRNDGPTVSRFQCKPTAPGATSFFRFALEETYTARMSVGGKRNPDAIKALKEQKNPFAMLGLSQRNADGKVVDDEGAAKAMANFFTAYGALMMMFALVMMTAQPMLQSVLEEKTSKVSELLLGSAQPIELMYGKLLGGLGVALTLSAVLLGGGMFMLYRMDYADQVPAALVPWFVFYAALAITMYGALFLAAGSVCSDAKEAQSLLTPVTLIMTLPMFLLLLVLINPNSFESRLVSLFPPATPSLMVARIALGAEIPWWEHALGVTGVAATTLLCVWAAGRIFRIGFLMAGKPPKLGELLKWVVKA